MDSISGTGQFSCFKLKGQFPRADYTLQKGLKPFPQRTVLRSNGIFNINIPDFSLSAFHRRSKSVVHMLIIQC